MIKRTIYPYILKSIKNKPITLITGARQVGKSTLCKELVHDLGFNYISLDNLRERQSAINDPEMFLQIHKWPLIVDEVQHAPKLFDIIEQIVNEEKFTNGKNYGMYVLTGSQTFKLLESVSESMAGRVSIIRMSPLSVSEINEKEELPFEIDIIKSQNRTKDYRIDINNLFKMIVKGMYPELYDNKELDFEMFYSDYVDTYINKDVSKILKLTDKLKFQNFMEILASMTGEELVYDTIAKAVGVSIPTIQSWISVLVAGDIIHLLQPYNENFILKRVVKRPKIYFWDTGLACYLARLNDSDTLRVSRFCGRFVETYIVNEIMKSYQNNAKKPNFYYYRDSDQKEIDLIILNKGKLNFIECKSGVSFKLSDVSSFETLEKRTNYLIEKKCIVCNTNTVYSLGDNVIVLPITAI